MFVALQALWSRLFFLKVISGDNIVARDVYDACDVPVCVLAGFLSQVTGLVMASFS